MPEIVGKKNDFDIWSFENVGDRFEAACGWLTDMGVNVSPSRVGRYRRDVSDLVTSYNASGPEHEALLSRLDEMLVTLFEVTELITIHERLCTYPDQGSLHARLHRLSMGPGWSGEEISNNSSTHARNVAFELLMAARCIAAGYDVDLSSDADVIASKGGYSIIIECKRPQSPDALERNLKSAFKQLACRYASGDPLASDRGIVAISINKAVPVANQVLTTPDHLTLGDQVRQIAEQFRAEHHHRWAKADKRTIGVLLNFRAPTILQEPNMITIANQDIWDSLASDSRDDSRLYEMVKALADRFG
jgi:hypothetical protein